MNGFVIAAPRSGSGKTIVTLGLIAALRARGFVMAAAKTGPDYIDTAILSRVSGRPATTLDPWAMRPDRLVGLAAHASQGADFLAVEGVMGLFDGAADGTGSTADLAGALGLPVILVVDAERQSQSIAALVHGFASFRPGLAIAGVIVNRAASSRHEAMLRQALSPLGLPILGVLPRRADLVLPERHLGLVLPDEVDHFDEVVRRAAEVVGDYVDLNRLAALSVVDRPRPDPRAVPLPPLGQRIGIARDACFAFLYSHWLDDWRAAGAELRFFSPLADEAPGSDLDAIFLPGGYPELHGPGLAAATRFQTGLREAAGRGALIYGECGGFMVLGEAITDRDGQRHPMLGLLPHETRIDRPRRVLGYRHLTHAGALPFPKRLRGHEFHYSSAKRITGPALFTSTDALGEEQLPMGLVIGRVMGSYAHVIDAE